MFVADVLSVRLTRFTRPYYSVPCQIVRCRPGGKVCVGSSTPHASLRTDSARAPPCKSTTLYDATTYTQFATWAAVDCLARRAVPRELEAGEAHRKDAGNGRGSRGCRVKRKNLWAPSGKH